MKIFSARNVISVLSFTLFALCLADKYLTYKSDVDASIIRLKETLKPAEVAPEAAEAETTEATAETAETTEGDTANGQQ